MVNRIFLFDKYQQAHVINSGPLHVKASMIWPYSANFEMLRFPKFDGYMLLIFILADGNNRSHMAFIQPSPSWNFDGELISKLKTAVFEHLYKL